MKASFILLFISIFYTSNIFCQDYIVLKDSTVIKSKVVEIGNKTIKYKKYENIEGPIYIIKQNTVSHINYQNGDTEQFSLPKSLFITTNNSTSEVLSYFYFEFGFNIPFGSFGAPLADYDHVNSDWPLHSARYSTPIAGDYKSGYNLTFGKRFKFHPRLAINTQFNIFCNKASDDIYVFYDDNYGGYDNEIASREYKIPIAFNAPLYLGLDFLLLNSQNFYLLLELNSGINTRIFTDSYYKYIRTSGEEFTSIYDFKWSSTVAYSLSFKAYIYDNFSISFSYHNLGASKIYGNSYRISYYYNPDSPVDGFTNYTSPKTAFDCPSLSTSFINFNFGYAF